MPEPRRYLFTTGMCVECVFYVCISFSVKLCNRRFSTALFVGCVCCGVDPFSRSSPNLNRVVSIHFHVFYLHRRCVFFSMTIFFFFNRFNDAFTNYCLTNISAGFDKRAGCLQEKRGMSLPTQLLRASSRLWDAHTNLSYSPCCTCHLLRRPWKLR